MLCKHVRSSWIVCNNDFIVVYRTNCIIMTMLILTDHQHFMHSDNMCSIAIDTCQFELGIEYFGVQAYLCRSTVGLIPPGYAFANL